MSDIHKNAYIRIKPREYLEWHANNLWTRHHPPMPEQFEFGSSIKTIKEIQMYHGGDLLYILEETPGIWREDCIEEIKRIYVCNFCGERFRVPSLSIDINAKCPHCNNDNFIGAGKPNNASQSTPKNGATEL